MLVRFPKINIILHYWGKRLCLCVNCLALEKLRLHFDANHSCGIYTRVRHSSNSFNRVPVNGRYGFCLTQYLRTFTGKYICCALSCRMKYERMTLCKSYSFVSIILPNSYKVIELSDCHHLFCWTFHRIKRYESRKKLRHYCIIIPSISVMR